MDPQFTPSSTRLSHPPIRSYLFSYRNTRLANEVFAFALIPSPTLFCCPPLSSVLTLFCHCFSRKTHVSLSPPLSVLQWPRKLLLSPFLLSKNPNAGFVKLMEFPGGGWVWWADKKVIIGSAF